MPGGLLGAISGILAGGILGFGAAEWSLLLDTFARSAFFAGAHKLLHFARADLSIAMMWVFAVHTLIPMESGL